MSVIHRDIFITKNQYVHPIDVVQDSKVGIELSLMDYDIPDGAWAKAFARGRFTPATYKTDCAVSGNTVYFIPPDGLFIPGPNRLQIEINGVIIPFSIDVNCESRVSDAGDPATPEQVQPLAVRAELAATAAEQSQQAVKVLRDELEANYPLVPQLQQELAGTDSRLSESIGGLENNIDGLENIVKNQEMLSKGFTWDELTEEYEAAAVTSPDDASIVDVIQIDGKTIDRGGILVSAVVDYISSGESIYAIPQDVMSLPCYGLSAKNVCNNICNIGNTWNYYQRVGCVDLGSLKWAYNAVKKCFISSTPIPNCKYTENNPNIIIAGYTEANISSIWDSTLDKTVGLSNTYLSSLTKQICIRDTVYSTVSAFSAAMSGKMMQYELEEISTTDISLAIGQSLSGINISGNSFAFHSDSGLDVHSKVRYTLPIRHDYSIINQFHPIASDVFTINNKFIATDGRELDDEHGEFCCSDFIHLNAGDEIEYRYSTENTKIGAICVYNEDESFVNCVSSYSIIPKKYVYGTYIAIESCYVRICTEIAFKPTSFLRFKGIESSIADRVNNNQKTVSILFIGNSMTVDAVFQLPALLNEIMPEVKFNICGWYNGGYDLLGQYNDYILPKVPCQLFYHSDRSIWMKNSDTYTMDDILSKYEFDIVCLQEYFNVRIADSGAYKDDDLDTFNSIIEYIRARSKKAFKVATLWHTPKPDSPKVDNIFNLQKAGIKKIYNESVCESVIPCGVATYRARFTDLDSLGNSGHLSIDGTHTQEGLPCMIQSYVCAMWLCEMLGIPRGINSSKTRITKENYTKLVDASPYKAANVIAGTEEQFALAQTVAVMAYKECKKILRETVNTQ